MSIPSTANQYDALNRLKQVICPNLGVARYAYKGLATPLSQPQLFRQPDALQLAGGALGNFVEEDDLARYLVRGQDQIIEPDNNYVTHEHATLLPIKKR